MPLYTNPLELARAELGKEFDPDSCSMVSENDGEVVKRLHIAARDNSFMDAQYWVETAQGLVLPTEMPERTTEFSGSLIELRDVTFAGILEGFHKFSIGKHIASWCLRFGETVLVPGLDKMPEEKRFWVPAVSIRQIDVL